ncbi:hypothetical protein NpPPO83_00011255 [Neofusicoccum parvum]|uniref:Uncharacterized protein n=1 Tax=Neofusicoccum parvum TaxID=310453 RepID=A0ACB5SQB7_9PEZI|nr:hypothetical protein NpPPO83_00011255 [Neofusicoccum parvum]
MRFNITILILIGSTITVAAPVAQVDNALALLKNAIPEPGESLPEILQELKFVLQAALEAMPGVDNNNKKGASPTPP